jgi:hypothetical protein
MSSPSNAAVEAIRSLYRALATCRDDAGVRAAVDAAYAEAAVQHGTGPRGSDVRGAAAIASVTAHLLRALRNVAFTEVFSAVNADGTGVVLFRATAAQDGPLLGLIPASGRDVAVPLYEVARVNAAASWVAKAAVAASSGQHSVFTMGKLFKDVGCLSITNCCSRRCKLWGNRWDFPKLRWPLWICRLRNPIC